MIPKRDFPTKYMLIPPSPPLLPPFRNDYFYERCSLYWTEFMVDYVYIFRWHLNFQVYHRPRNKLPSKVAKFTWKMRNVLKWMKNQFFDFSLWDMNNFLRYKRFCTKIQIKRFMLAGLQPSKLPVFAGGLLPCIPRPQLLLDWILISNWFSVITD